MEQRAEGVLTRGQTRDTPLSPWALNRHWTRARRHPIETLHRALKLMDQHSNREIAAMLGIPVRSIESWRDMRFLPKTGKLSFPNVIKLIERARLIFQTRNLDPMMSLREACAQMGFNLNSVNVYLCHEALPTLPGFPLYRDARCQAQCEAYGLGLRPCGGLFGLPVPDTLRKHPPSSQAAQSPSVPASKPPRSGRPFVREVRATVLLPRRTHYLPAASDTRSE
ncbi:hypothetical protein [Thiocapsa sp. N5-Cardenillas]|uniref:hypothetical protein n=1 Tax=Thiocapsa sp. N5-Cardenillas TaxID=3137397 RepID=UPI0035B2D0B0